MRQRRLRYSVNSLPDVSVKRALPNMPKLLHFGHTRVLAKWTKWSRFVAVMPNAGQSISMDGTAVWQGIQTTGVKPYGTPLRTGGRFADFLGSVKEIPLMVDFWLFFFGRVWPIREHLRIFKIVLFWSPFGMFSIVYPYRHGLFHPRIGIIGDVVAVRCPDLRLGNLRNCNPYVVCC